MKKRNSILLMKYRYSDISQNGMHQALNKIGFNNGQILEGVPANASEFNDVITILHLHMQII